jgi:hypothetical protein
MMFANLRVPAFVTEMIDEFVFEVKFVAKLRGVVSVDVLDCKRIPLYGNTIPGFVLGVTPTWFIVKNELAEMFENDCVVETLR